ncbi:hypothetical protein RRG08_047683 [Elysia crispata]|uniref:Uncharacterized protein n=1 Tax=Elysia crispata TaxID=231223 RepID=A0AAE1BD32_9GAST|nr:hypothetical protein RRG08_047683 [Elysia crispata]
MADCLSCPASELNNIVLDRDFKVIGTAQEQDADCGAWQTANTGFKIVPFTVQGSKQQQKVHTPLSTSHHGNLSLNVTPTLEKTHIVFVCRDGHRGPVHAARFRLTVHGDKTFLVIVSGREAIMTSTDRLKPSNLDLTLPRSVALQEHRSRPILFLYTDQEERPSSTPATFEP